MGFERLVYVWPFTSLLVACSAGSAATSPNNAMASGGVSAFGGAAPTGGGGVGVPTASPAGAAVVAAGGSTSFSSAGAGGVTGSGGAAGAPPSVMTSAPAAYPYDTGVKFDWPATTPMAGKCRPGTYAGTFSCDVNLGLGMLKFAGPVQFTLAEGGMGEFLVIQNGTLRADDMTQGATGSGTLTGSLDCSTNTFHATIRDGMYVVTIVAGSFLGTLDGHLDRLTETLTGTWSFVPVLGNLPSGGAPDAAVVKLPVSCEGTWSVARQPVERSSIGLKPRNLRARR